MELDYKAIGERIRTARLNKKFTQDKIAEMTELSNTHVSNIENGTTKVSLPTLVKIANSLEVSVDELLCDNLKKSREVFNNEIVSICQDCDDTEIKIMADTLKALKDSLKNRLKI